MINIDDILAEAETDYAVGWPGGRSEAFSIPHLF
jgi:hypothetical protein